MKKMVFIVLFITLFVITTVRAAISTYQDSALTQSADVFADGGKVYVTVSGFSVNGGTKTITVTNNETPAQSVSVDIYDHGKYYDKTANDGIYTGMFIVTTKLTLSPNKDESVDQPLGFCYKIVENIHLPDQGTAVVAVTYEDDSKEDKSVKLVTLFNVQAMAVKDTSAAICWNTSDSGYSRVDYGLTAAYGSSVAQETPVKDLRIFHSVVLSNLSPTTLYHYQVTSLDTYGETRVSEDCTFTTISAESLADKIKLSRKLKDLPKTYYVKIGGKDTDSGLSSEQAWEHPSFAVQKAEAGDTIYLLEGTWNDEHLILANSGIDVAPITLTTYDNKISILDGVDKTGFGIRANGKTSWNISGLHLKNYSNGIYFQDKTTDIQVSNFTIENTQNAAITFNSKGPFSRLLFSNFEVYAAGLGAGDTALSYGGGSNFSDIEIFNFNIHDTNGSGIYWRYVDRLHINDGKVYKAAGTDGVGFSLSVCNSIMENLVVDNTQWHGVAVHDWTVGNNPCFNNTIRNCEISNVSHNHVDLHSGAYNTLVEKNVLHDQLSFCTGIYFHNRGAGLIARDNNIYRVSRGVSGGGYKEYPLTDIIIQNNTIHDCLSYSFDLANKNILIKGNRLYNDPSSDTLNGSGSNIVMEDNDIDEGKNYRINSGDYNVVRNPRDKAYNVRCVYGSKITLEYTNNRVYKQAITWNNGPYTIEKPVWTPGKSYTVMSSTPSGGITLKITTYPMTANPQTGSASITVNKFDLSLSKGETLVEVVAETADGNNVDFVIGDLKAETNYEIKRSSLTCQIIKSNANQYVKFSNSEWSTKTFTITETDTEADIVTPPEVEISQPSVPIINIPTAPQNLAAAAGNGQIALSWLAPVSDGGSPVTGYKIYRNENLITAVGVILSYADTAVIKGLNYDYRVSAVNAAGESLKSNEVSVTLQDATSSPENLAKITVFPNPFIKGKSGGERISFANLPKDSTIKIYDLAGGLVKEFSADSSGKAEWDTNEIASGVYLYVIIASEGTKKGKISVIK
ncbi:MAG: right-handed parallel beta-helix repeat-containing protein [Elusimicrobiota bacterium]